jgi:hypothetical protein
MHAANPAGSSPTFASSLGVALDFQVRIVSFQTGE